MRPPPRSGSHPRDGAAFPPDLAGAVARASVDPTAAPRALQDALQAAIAARTGRASAARRGYPLDEGAPAWCLDWLMADEWRARAFA